MADSTSLGTKTLVEHALNANPSNAVGYGILVAILIIAVSALWYDRRQLQNQLTKQAEKHLAYVKRLRDALEKERNGG